MSGDWTDRLSSEDRAFLKRFLLASGSLKAVAEAYGVSYPTIRNRLNKLIAKVEIFDSEQPMSEFERQLRAAYADGAFDLTTLKHLLSTYQKERDNVRGQPPHDGHTADARGGRIHSAAAAGEQVPDTR